MVRVNPTIGGNWAIYNMTLSHKKRGNLGVDASLFQLDNIMLDFPGFYQLLDCVVDTD